MTQRKTEQNKVLFIELNEFNYDLLKSYADQFNFKNIQKILSFHLTHTYTEDTYESDYLEPWVQWVSVHTGQPSTSHQIKHLGDVPSLHSEQIWETLSKKGITSGIWGPMNASKGCAENCLFFLPDPWTVSENAFPLELKPLLDLLRYSTQNYLNTSHLKIFHKLSNVLLFLANEGLISAFSKEIPNMMKYSKEFKKEAFVYISLFDYLSTLIFLKMKKKYDPDFSLIFLNSLAHLQHHHWQKEDGKSDERFKYGLKYLDKAFEHIFNSLEPEDTIIVANALSQKCTKEEKPWFLYRQKDQKQFLQKIGLKFEKVEAHMTHDAHIFFKTAKECYQAFQILQTALLDGQPLFYVETYFADPLKLFYKIIFTDKANENSKLKINNKELYFFDLFQTVVQRTGKHIQSAHMLSNKDIYPKEISNHEIFHYLYQACHLDEKMALSAH